MNKILHIALCGLLVASFPATIRANEDSPVCTNIGGVMFGKETVCKKGDIIMVNPMMAAFLCDMALPIITGDKIIVCHYLGKKRPERKSQKTPD